MQEWFGTAFKSRCSDNFWKFSSKNAWFSSLPVKISAGWKCSSCRMVYAPTWKDFKGKRVEWVSPWKIFEKLVLFSMLEIRKVIRKNLLYRLVLIKKTWIGTLLSWTLKWNTNKQYPFGTSLKLFLHIWW